MFVCLDNNATPVVVSNIMCLYKEALPDEKDRVREG